MRFLLIFLFVLSIQLNAWSETDSTRLQHQNKWYSSIIGGTTLRSEEKKQTLYIEPLLPYNFQFNSVEGFNISFAGTYYKELSNKKSLIIQPTIHYGFSSYLPSGNASISYRYNSLHKAAIKLQGGTEIIDFNNRGSIGVLFNSFNNLFNNENYLKLYERRFITLSHSAELIQGWQWNAVLDYSIRVPLVNSSYYSFNSQNSDKLTANNPYYGEDNNPAFEKNNSFTFTIGFVYSFMEAGSTLGDYLPQFAVTYKTAPAIIGANTEYSSLNLKIYHLGIPWHKRGETAFNLAGGFFPNNKSMYYMDYQMFRGNRLVFYEGSSQNVYRFLDYYKYSCQKYYVEGHIEHNFSKWMYTAFPFLQRWEIQELAGGNYLKNDLLNHYGEMYIGLHRRLWRLEYGWSWQNGSLYKQGIRVCASF